MIKYRTYRKLFEIYKMRKLIILLFIFPFFSCQASDLGQKNSTPPSHQIFDELLKKHVNKAGVVNYKGFIEDKDKLEKYLDLLSDNAPDRQKWSKEQQLAYWINAYNAFTVKLIIDNYPVNSIQDLHPKIKIPGQYCMAYQIFQDRRRRCKP